MGKAKWWVCDGCHSLNDLPANKCYNCRAAKPANPRQIDDRYDEVVSNQRVGITVDLSQVGDLSRRDPIETQSGGGIIEAFAEGGAEAGQAPAPAPQPYDPYAPAPPPAAPTTATPTPTTTQPVPPLREPERRGIEQLGGRRSWADPAELPPAPAPPRDPSVDATPED